MPATRFIRRLALSFSKRYNALRFWLASRNGRVRKAGRIYLNVPLLCDGAGLVSLGSEVTIGYQLASMIGDGRVRLQARGADSQVHIGSGTSFSNNAQVFAEQSISIGCRCLIGDSVMIMDSDFHDLSANGRHSLPAITAPVVLEDNVFIGSRVIILKGVTIGRDSVIGAGSVVVRSIPSGVIAAGNPARVIRPL